MSAVQRNNGPQVNFAVPRRNRRGSASPFCRVTGKSIDMEDHHYIPSWEDVQQHGSPYRCRITEKNKYFKDYKYVYPIIDVDGTTRMITEHDFHCRITSKYRAMSGYKYIYPVLGASTDKTKKEMSSVMEDPLLKDVLVPTEVEQIIRGGIEDVLRLHESEYLFIISKEGSVFPAALKEISPWKKKKIDSKFARRHTMPVSLDVDLIVNAENFNSPPIVKKIGEIKAVVPDIEVDQVESNEKIADTKIKIADTKVKDSTKKRTMPSSGKKRNSKKSKSEVSSTNNGNAESVHNSEDIQNGFAENVLKDSNENILKDSNENVLKDSNENVLKDNNEAVCNGSSEHLSNAKRKGSTAINSIMMKDEESMNCNIGSEKAHAVSNGICDNENESSEISNCSENKKTSRLSRLERYKLTFQNFEQPKDNTSGNRLVLVGAYDEDEAVELDFGDTDAEQSSVKDNSEYARSNPLLNGSANHLTEGENNLNDGKNFASPGNVCEGNEILRQASNITSASGCLSEISSYFPTNGFEYSLNLKKTDEKRTVQPSVCQNNILSYSPDDFTHSGSLSNETTDSSGETVYSLIMDSISSCSSSPDIDVSKTKNCSTVDEKMHFNDNRIADIDISKSSNLNDSGISDIDVSKTKSWNTVDEKMHFNYNGIVDIDISKTSNLNDSGIADIDVSKTKSWNTVDEKMHFSDNGIAQNWSEGHLANNAVHLISNKNDRRNEKPTLFHETLFKSAEVCDKSGEQNHISFTADVSPSSSLHSEQDTPKLESFRLYDIKKTSFGPKNEPILREAKEDIPKMATGFENKHLEITMNGGKNHGDALNMKHQEGPGSCIDIGDVMRSKMTKPEELTEGNKDDLSRSLSSVKGKDAKVVNRNSDGNPEKQRKNTDSENRNESLSNNHKLLNHDPSLSRSDFVSKLNETTSDSENSLPPFQNLSPERYLNGHSNLHSSKSVELLRGNTYTSKDTTLTDRHTDDSCNKTEKQIKCNNYSGESQNRNNVLTDSKACPNHDSSLAQTDLISRLRESTEHGNSLSNNLNNFSIEQGLTNHDELYYKHCRTAAVKNCLQDTSSKEEVIEHKWEKADLFDGDLILTEKGRESVSSANHFRPNESFVPIIEESSMDNNDLGSKLSEKVIENKWEKADLWDSDLLLSEKGRESVSLANHFKHSESFVPIIDESSLDNNDPVSKLSEKVLENKWEKADLWDGDLLLSEKGRESVSLANHFKHSESFVPIIDESSLDNNDPVSKLSEKVLENKWEKADLWDGDLLLSEKGRESVSSANHFKHSESFVPIIDESSLDNNDLGSKLSKKVIENKWEKADLWDSDLLLSEKGRESVSSANHFRPNESFVPIIEESSLDNNDLGSKLSEKVIENKWEKADLWDSDLLLSEKGRESVSSVNHFKHSESFVPIVNESLKTTEKTFVERISKDELESEVTESQKMRLPTTTALLCRKRIFPGANVASVLCEVASGLGVTNIFKDYDSRRNLAKSNKDTKQVPDVYVAIMDFEPMESDDDAVSMKEGQRVEVVDNSKPRRWLVRTRPVIPGDVAKEGWVPACYLEKSTTERTLGYLVTEPEMDPKEIEAIENREAVVKELVETEEDFAKDLQYVVENYYNYLDSPSAPKEMRDRKGSIFGNFKDICDFHNNVLIKGVQYHAKEPTKLGKTFLRLERDFDMHAGYCWNEARAQQLLQEGPLRHYFDEHSKMIDDDKTLSDHLKLPIQRLNDYQLLLKEIIKYSSRLDEDTSDLQKALDFIHSINKRTKDLQYVQSLKGCTGDILRLGRIIKHDMFDATEGSQATTSERLVFLFKGRIFLTEKRMEDGKENYHVTNLFKLQEVEMVENVPEDPLQIIFRHTKKSRAGFPLTLKAKTQEQKDIWIKELTSGTQAEDLGDQEPALLGRSETPSELQIKPSKPAVEEERSADEEKPSQVKPSELKHKAEGHAGEPETKKSKVAKQKSVEEPVKKKESTESALQTPTKDKEPDFKKTKRQISKEGAAKELAKEESETKVPKESETKTPEKKPEEKSSKTTEQAAGKPPVPKDQDKGKKPPKPGKSGQEGESEQQAPVDLGESESPCVVRVMSEDASDSDARVEVLENMDAGEDNATVASESLRSGSVSPVDGTDMATKPGFSKTLRGVTCSLGEAATLECETEGTPAPSVAWLKDNRKITKSKRIETTSKGQKHSLKIKDTTADDAGLYTVVANNASGSASCSAPLNLKMALLGLPKEDSRPTTPGGTLLPQAPVFKVKLNKETQLLEGTCVRFELVVRGHPEPTVKFFKDNKELKPNERVRVVYESKEVFELILDHVVASDAGSYSCVATNSEGSDTTVGNLTVTKTKDVFKGLEEELLEEEREPSPRPRTPKFKWFKNGQDFEASERFQVMFNEEDDSLALLFQHVTPDDAGLYTCVASTSTGSKIACSAELTVQGVIRQVEAPAIKAELSDVEASEGGSAMLELKITGYPKPKVTWFHKKKEVQSGGRFRFLFADEESFTLVIKSVTKDDGGQYTVKAANEMGEVESSCKLTVKSAPSFVKGLKDMSVMADEVIKFEVEIDGNPAPEIKWYKDGQQVSPSDRVKITSADKKCCLQISKAKPGDSGSYSCVLTNSLGSQAEFSNVVVKASPTFIKEMENIEGVESDTLQFSVEVAGNPKPSLKWSKDGKDLKVDGKRVKVIEEGANAYSLVIDKATLSDTGVYTCELRNEHGMKASSGNLNLKTKPEFIKKLSDQEAKEGDANLELTVTLKGYPSPSTKWSLDGKDLSENKNCVITQDKQTGAHSLRIKKVHRDLSGKYSCEASNSMGTAVTSGVLSVHVPSKKPEFDQSLKPVQLVEGKPGKLEAKVSGEPRPKIKWLKDGKEITPNGHYTVKEEPDGSLSLLIDNVTAGDAGTYAIVAVSDMGEATCEAPVTTIPAGQKPKFVKELEKVNLMEGQPLKLAAKVEGSPTSIKWQKDGDDISPSDRIALTEEADGNIALKIDEVNRNDAGKYTVIATNAEGKARSAALVEVKAVSKPEVLSSLEPLTLTDGETGQLKAKISGEPKPIVKWLKDGKELKPSNRIEAGEEPDGTMTLTIKNARPEDAGNYSILVSNVRGEAKNSAPVTVNQAPTFHKPLKAVDVVEGYPAKLEAKIGGSPLPELKWKKDDKEVIPDGVHVKEIRNPDGTVALLIDDCKPEDAGKYSLSLKNPLGEQSSDGDLSVAGKGSSTEPESAPNFVGPIGDVSVKEGDPIRFETAVSGNPLPDISWVFNNEPIKPSEDVLMTFDGKKAILEIKHSKPEHIGTYQCNLSNPLGKATSDGTASVQEKTAPRFTQRLTDFSGCIGKPMKMSCKVKGYPDPEIDWYHNGNRIDAGAKYTIGRTGDVCSLSVNDCKPEDSGIYECKASNPLGEDATRAEASISDKVEKGEPPLFLKKIGDNEVMEGMTARFTACITGIPTPEIKCYAEAESNAQQNYSRFLNGIRGIFGRSKDGQPLDLTHRHKTELDSTGILRMVVKDVEPGDYGEYSVVISNCHGSATSSAHIRPDSLDQKYISPIGDQFIDFDKFKKTGAPVPLPDKPKIIRMYDEFLTLGWKPSVPNTPRIPVTYQIEMAKHPDGEWSPYKTGLRDTLCDVQGLTPGQDYKFRIRVENKYGVSEPSPYTTAHRSKIYEPRAPADFEPKDFEIEHPPLEKIAAAPRFLRKGEDTMYGIRGHPVTITFYLYGHPEPQVSWCKDDVKIEKGKFDFMQDRNGKVSLFIDPMSSSYIGTYLCHAVNDEGEARMKIKLLIAEAPVFIKRLDETTGLMRRCGRMQCKVTGVPYPKIKWHRDWHPLYESEKVKILWEEPDVCTLFISNLITRDAGLYSCSASNIAGSTSCSASLNVEDSEDIFDIKTYSRPITVKPRSKPFEDFYDLGDELGRGTQGITYHAVKRDTGNSYATKMMHGKGKLKHFMKNEMDIMNQICHPKLVRLWDAFDTKDSMTLLSDICGGGELLDNILKRGTLTEREVAHYIKQLLEGLDHMHGRYIGHLGLTVGDLLVSRVNSYDIKVGDFGLAARLIPGKDYFLEYGHPEFVAPEIANKLPATLLADMWSVGVITYLLLSGISPFLGEHDRETLTRVQQGKISFSPEAFSGVTDDAKDFMSKILVFDPSGRMNVKTALQHRWLKDYADVPTAADKPLNNIDRLKDYYRRWKDWYANASCRTYYRRRTLESCFHHPSRMIYPPGEEYTPASSPEPDLERTRVKPSHFDDTYKQKINREEIDFRSESNYQNGPDTYLLQLRDTDFPLRLRQYLRVGASTSPSLAVSLRERHWGDSTLVIRERRKFVDVMDEEIDDERKGLSTRTVPMRLYHEIGTLGYAHEQMELLKKEVWKDKGSRELEIGSQPYFREVIEDTVMKEDEKVVFTCYAVGTPKPNYAWFRNDGILLESSRVVVKELENGKCELRINPSRAYDAGVYKCVARNMHGVTICRARLKIGDKPGRPEAPVIKQLSDTEAYLTWSSPRDEGHSPTLCYELDYKKSDSSEWTTLRSNIIHEFFVIHNLIPSTFYQFRVKAMNKFGWGEPGYSTEPISTKGEGSDPVKISIHRKFQQELTETSSEFVPDDIEQTNLDYSRENNAVPLTEGETMDLYRIVSEVARGRFSVILNVWVKQSSTTCIAKVIQSTPSANTDVRQECDVLRSLCHEKIVTLLSASYNGQKTVLVMEKLSGIDVLTYLSRRQDYNEELVIKIIKQVFEAIHYLHFRGICYIELQPDNVVMADARRPDIKLVDFGSARSVPKSGGKVDVKGTVEYLAPEVVKNEDVSTLTDVWAVGILTYILLSGVSPFRGKTDEETKENVSLVRYQFDNLYTDITTEATRFILNIFKACPIKRPTVGECLENKWLLPSEYMIMKRESARFLPDKLFEFAKEFHSTKAEAMNPELLTSLGMSSSKKEIQEVEY